MAPSPLNTRLSSDSYYHCISVNTKQAVLGGRMTARYASSMAARNHAIHFSRCATKDCVTGKLHFIQHSATERSGPLFAPTNFLHDKLPFPYFLGLTAFLVLTPLATQKLSPELPTVWLRRRNSWHRSCWRWQPLTAPLHKHQLIITLVSPYFLHS